MLDCIRILSDLQLKAKKKRRQGPRVLPEISTPCIASLKQRWNYCNERVLDRATQQGEQGLTEQGKQGELLDFFLFSAILNTMSRSYHINVSPS
jgi:hypothetical protein